MKTLFCSLALLARRVKATSRPRRIWISGRAVVAVAVGLAALVGVVTGCSGDVATGVSGPAEATDAFTCEPPSWKIATGSCDTRYKCVADNPCSAAAPTSGCSCAGEVVSVAAGCPNTAYGWSRYGLSYLTERAPNNFVPCDPSKQAPEALDVRVTVTDLLVGEVDDPTVHIRFKSAWSSTWDESVDVVAKGGQAVVTLAARWPTDVPTGDVMVEVFNQPATVECPKGVDLAGTASAVHDFDLRDFVIETSISAKQLTVSCKP